MDVTEKIAGLKAEKKARRKKKIFTEVQIQTMARKTVSGDASETAIVNYFQPIENIEETRFKFLLSEVKPMPRAGPIYSINKFARSIVRNTATSGSHYTLFIKGAPDSILINDSVDTKWMKEFEKANDIFGRGGQRVLGFAKLSWPATQYELSANGKDFQFNTAVAAHYPDFLKWN
jgi:sodium/potassium-transporting ATPase subunit alpha